MQIICLDYFIKSCQPAKLRKRLWEEPLNVMKILRARRRFRRMLTKTVHPYIQVTKCFFFFVGLSHQKQAVPERRRMDAGGF